MGVVAATAPPAGFLHRRDEDGGLLLGVGAEVVEEQSPSPSPSPPPMSSCGRYILHRVCRFDTLAGVAIRYGVEVADVKRANGLTTDLHMFAHKTLRIPLPGRHPPAASPSPCAAADRTRERTTRRPPKNASLDPFLKPPCSADSPSMSPLQGYYGLAPTQERNQTNEGTEMATYSIGQHRKARSISDGFPLVKEDVGWETEDAEKPIRRRQKADIELSTKEDNNGSLMARTGQGLALRPKPGYRPDTNNSQHGVVATMVPSYGDGLLTVRKSSSSPEFQDSDHDSIALVWLKSKWSLKPDAFTLLLPITLFDSILKPIVAWRNKAARD